LLTRLLIEGPLSKEDPLPELHNRAGSYEKQPTGYRAFVPAPLPPQPKIELAGELQQLLSNADVALGRLDGSIQTLPNPDLFVLMYVRKEAVLSSQIEGTQSSTSLQQRPKSSVPKRPRMWTRL
jgi:cell filamentation protein, protein adenylyltransferase